MMRAATCIVLAALVTVCAAGGGARISPVTQQVLDQNVDSEPTNYNFAYSADSHSRSESREGRVVRGQYSVLGADGISRIVQYVADENGFRASISTNEPGTESQSPADVNLDSSQPPARELAELYGPSYTAAASAPVYSAPAYASKGGWAQEVQAPIAAPVVHRTPVVSAPIIQQWPVHVAAPLQSSYGIRIQHSAPQVPLPVPLAPVIRTAPAATKGREPVSGSIKSPVRRIVAVKQPPAPATKTFQPPAVKTPFRRVVAPLIPIPAPPAIRTVPPPTVSHWQEPQVVEQQQQLRQEEAQEEEPQQQEQQGALTSYSAAASDEESDQWSGSSR